MRKLIPFIVIILLTSACTITVEPRYQWHDRIVGYYEVNEYSNTYNATTYYGIFIDDYNGYDEVWIENFYGVGVGVFAYIDYDGLIIPNQRVNGFEIEGVGTIYSTHIDLSYSVRDWKNGGVVDFLDATAWVE